MRNYNRRLFLIFSSILAVALISCAVLLKHRIKAGVCLIHGGKFASSINQCIYKNCAETSSCLPSYRNSMVCKKLKLGISKNELFFALGMPIESEGDIYYFDGNGTEPYKVKATILNGKVESLQCEI